MEDYKEVKLKKYRTTICFSVLYLTFFGGKFYKTDELFGWTNLRQQKVKTDENIKRLYTEVRIH